jgi:hypothetical protein
VLDQGARDRALTPHIAAMRRLLPYVSSKYGNTILTAAAAHEFQPRV